MASPHAAGLAALLLSALAPGDSGRSMAATHQAGAHGHRAADAGRRDSSTRAGGCPRSERRYRWLAGRAVRRRMSQVRVPGTGGHGGLVERAAGARGRYGRAASSCSARSGGAPARTPCGRMPPGSSAPPGSRSQAAATASTLRYAAAKLAAPGAYTGTVTGWAGGYAGRARVPAGDHVVVPRRCLRTTASAPSPRRRSGPVASCARSSWPTAPGRSRCTRHDRRVGPAGSRFSTSPTGMPFRDGSAVAGRARRRRRLPDGRARRRGRARTRWTSLPPSAGRSRSTSGPAGAGHAAGGRRRGGRGRRAPDRRRAASAVTAQVELAIRSGRERSETFAARGSAIRRDCRSSLPPGRRRVVVDVAMDREQWGRFTDFGLTLFDSARPPARASIRWTTPSAASHGRCPRATADRPVGAGAFSRLRRSRRHRRVERARVRSGSTPTRWPRVPPASGDSASSCRDPGHDGDSPVRLPAVPLAARRRLHAAGRGRRACGRQAWTREAASRDRARACHEPARRARSPRGRDSGATGSRRRCARCGAGRSTTS